MPGVAGTAVPVPGVASLRADRENTEKRARDQRDGDQKRGKTEVPEPDHRGNSSNRSSVQQAGRYSIAAESWPERWYYAMLNGWRTRLHPAQLGRFGRKNVQQNERDVRARSPTPATRWVIRQQEGECEPCGRRVPRRIPHHRAARRPAYRTNLEPNGSAGVVSCFQPSWRVSP